jgi:hypothetical protein
MDSKSQKEGKDRNLFDFVEVLVPHGGNISSSISNKLPEFRDGAV